MESLLYRYTVYERPAKLKLKMLIVSTEASFLVFQLRFPGELYYHRTRPLQCEVQQRNLLKSLPAQQRNFLQYGAFGAGSTKDTFA